MTEDSLLDLKTAAAHTGQSVAALRRWIKEGRLPMTKQGNAHRVTAADVAAAVASAREDSQREREALAQKVVSTWPRLSPERKEELGRILAPGIDPLSSEGQNQLDRTTERIRVTEWARREAEKAPPFSPEQTDFIVGAFQRSLEEEGRRRAEGEHPPGG